MCTIFQKGNVLYRNYDCPVREGMTFVNQPGREKWSLVMPPAPVFRWTSKYGSIGFCQSGKGMPSGGINERGLIVEQCTCFETEYTRGDRPTISMLEAIQYLLDTCCSVEEAIAGFEDFCISAQTAKVHFYLMDQEGQAAIVEFQKGEKLVYRTPQPAVLANSSYEWCRQSAGETKTKYAVNSLQRFQRAVNGLNKGENPEKIIEACRQPSTVWTILYQQEERKIRVQTNPAYGFGVIELAKVDFEQSMLWDMDVHPEQVVWEPFTRAKNLENVRTFYENETALRVLRLEKPDFIIGAFDEHIWKIENQ